MQVHAVVMCARKCLWIVQICYDVSEKPVNVYRVLFFYACSPFGRMLLCELQCIAELDMCITRMLLPALTELLVTWTWCTSRFSNVLS